MRKSASLKFCTERTLNPVAVVAGRRVFTLFLFSLPLFLSLELHTRLNYSPSLAIGFQSPCHSYIPFIRASTS
ncbi:hypothetical protein L218DRAFT_965577 [Marasmius fiardii PR-910]|nr:hypothetical protein L218DRAFT_965577 [Marasmius fiardii PR-910]